MFIPQSIRPLVPLFVGLVLGGVGTALFLQSLPGAPGSAEAKVSEMEVLLTKAQNRVRALEGADGSRPSRGTFSDRARSLAENLREGKEVTPDDILRACQPLMRDLSPLFDRMRIHQQAQIADSMVGELARKYDLNRSQQESLKRWFAQQADIEAERYNRLALGEGTSVMELMRYSAERRPDEGLDQFMGTILSGEKLATFQQEHLAERIERVQNEADMRVERIDGIVKLDPEQRDQIFGIMARQSKDYDPSMAMEGGAGEITDVPGGNPREAMLSLLRPDQREAYEKEQQARRDDAREELEAIGLSLPADWDMLDGPNNW